MTTRTIPDLDTKAIIKRILSVIPPGTLAMEVFIGLLQEEYSTRVTTAAIYSSQPPRLILNPDFVAAHCQRDEHLFLLVMHEIWHLLLAHLRIYPRMTMAQNIATDTIINALLSREYKQPEFQGFLDKLYEADEFPDMLLRPPAGWSADTPDYPNGDHLPTGTLRILKQLYPSPGSSYKTFPFYSEIVDLFRRPTMPPNPSESSSGGSAVNSPQPPNGTSPTDPSEHEPSDTDNPQAQSANAPLLLGNHDDEIDEYLASDLFRSLFRDMMRGGDDGLYELIEGFEDYLQTLQVDQQSVAHQARVAFRRILRRCLNRGKGGEFMRKRQLHTQYVGQGVIMNSRDRWQWARAQLSSSLLRNRQPMDIVIRTDIPAFAHVYLDVSGSMRDCIGFLVDLLIPPARRHMIEVWQFSTAVRALPINDLSERRVTTSGGTDLNAVFQHIIEDVPADIRDIIILTDAESPEIKADYQAQLAKRGVQCHFVLPTQTSHIEKWKEFASTITILPGFEG